MLKFILQCLQNFNIGFVPKELFEFVLFEFADVMKYSILNNALRVQNYLIGTRKDMKNADVFPINFYERYISWLDTISNEKRHKRTK